MHTIPPMIGLIDEPENMWWLLCSLLTVFCFGVYGNLLHTGQVGMKDAKFGRYKAFLLVGVAYFVVAVILPILLLIPAEGGFDFKMSGSLYSLTAGAFGAVGAFCILLAFGAKGTPVVVMSIVFAGAPIVNAIFSIILHPPEGGIGSIHPNFYLGIVLAAIGGGLVTFYKPPPAPPHKKSNKKEILSPQEVADFLDKFNRPISAPERPKMIKKFPE